MNADVRLVLYRVDETGQQDTIKTLPVAPWQRDHAFANQQALACGADWYQLACGDARGISYAAARGRQGVMA